MEVIKESNEEPLKIETVTNSLSNPVMDMGMGFSFNEVPLYSSNAKSSIA